MPRVLTTKAVILCPHGGGGVSTASDPKWRVDGGDVLLDGDVGVLTSPPCVFPLPCAGYQLRSMGLNASTVDGRKVMLVTDFTQSFTGFPLILMETHAVFDHSTPTPLPSGSPPPPTPPELGESDQPSVTATPLNLVFSKSANPPSLATTYTLQSQFPRRWLLTRLNIPAAQHADITGGNPPDIVVAPSDGNWPTPMLSVAVTLLGTFLTTLPKGDHYLVLTAVNVRGKSAFAQVKLVVSP